MEYIGEISWRRALSGVCEDNSVVDFDRSMENAMTTPIVKIGMKYQLRVCAGRMRQFAFVATHLEVAVKSLYRIPIALLH
jgi:hypothetical protein